MSTPPQPQSSYPMMSNSSVGERNGTDGTQRKWRRGSTIVNDSTPSPAQRHVDGGGRTLFTMVLQQSAHGSRRVFGASILVVSVWSVLCALAAVYFKTQAYLDPNGTADRWLEDIEYCKYGISTIGSLFVFTLVFRFKACYDRWWESRVLWGSIISKSLELAMMNRSWIANEELANKMNRFIVVLGYASKSLLRGKSLGEDGEDGPALIKRKLLTQEELDDMHDNPSWQPYYCLHMLRTLIVEAHSIPGGKGLKMDETNKIHGQLFRCWDNSLKDLTKYVGHCIRLRTSGLPATYDAIVMVSYFTFFVLASVVWSAAIGWLTPIIIFAASSVVMFLIVMGTNMVDPFGYDKVDIPMEAFCRTIELQIQAVDERSNLGTMDRLASSVVYNTHLEQGDINGLE